MIWNNYFSIYVTYLKNNLSKLTMKFYLELNGIFYVSILYLYPEYFLINITDNYVIIYVSIEPICYSG